MNTVEQVRFNHKTDVYKYLKNLLLGKGQCFILVDENTRKQCLDRFLGKLDAGPKEMIEISAGEANKNLQQVEGIYEKLLSAGADRKSLLVNLGGGVLTDMGGFVAATFKRGIEYVNVPTSLLAMVDASLGGKTGVNFKQSKNQVGSFYQPLNVLIDTDYLTTLPQEEMISGYAEVIKHALIKDKDLWNDLKAISDIQSFNEWPSIIEKAVEIKLSVTESDLFEKGDRKLLNFGHTIGHGLESTFMKQSNELSHGHAVAVGMIYEAKLSVDAGHLSAKTFDEIKNYISDLYDIPTLSSQDIDDVLSFMKQDKKNEGGGINFTLLEDIGKGIIDNYPDVESVKGVLSSNDSRPDA